MGPNSEGEGIDYPPEEFQMFFAVSHGGSIDKPLLVGRRHAEWLKSEGAIILTREEYLKIKEEQ